MKIVSFTYCDEVTNDEQGKNIIINPMNMITPVSLPSNYSFMISFGVYDLNKDEGMNLKVDFTDSKGNLVAEYKLEISDLMKISNLPEDMKNLKKPISIQFNLSFKNVVLNESGEYKSNIKINDTNLGEYPIYVCSNI